MTHLSNYDYLLNLIMRSNYEHPFNIIINLLSWYLLNLIFC